MIISISWDVNVIFSKFIYTFEMKSILNKNKQETCGRKYVISRDVNANTMGGKARVMLRTRVLSVRVCLGGNRQSYMLISLLLILILFFSPC